MRSARPEAKRRSCPASPQPVSIPAHPALDMMSADTHSTPEYSMKDAAPKTIYLSDYTPFGYIVESVHLTFRLAPTTTRVISKIVFAPNPEAPDKTFFLHGEDLSLVWAKIDGAEISPEVSDTGLRYDV